jgi:hypothetical protein
MNTKIKSETQKSIVTSDLMMTAARELQDEIESELEDEDPELEKSRAILLENSKDGKEDIL